MDPIEKRPEESREDLRGRAAIDKIRQVVSKAQDCFFVTHAADSPTAGARPMNVRKVDDEGNLWFLSADDSHKNLEVSLDPTVDLYFHGSAHSDFLHLTGRATISTDRAKIEELWEPVIRTWFTGGKDDPRITAIRVAPDEGYYWDTKHGYAAAGIKMLLGALSKTLDEPVEGKLRV